MKQPSLLSPTTHFGFWTPVCFQQLPTISGSLLSRLFWQIGCIADEWVYLGSKRIIGKPQRINSFQWSFKTVEQKIKQSSLRKIIKVASYVFSGGLILITALTVKYLFKMTLNSIATLKNPNTKVFEKKFGSTTLSLWEGNLVDEKNVIINAANCRLLSGGGVCGAINEVAGDPPFDECQKLKQKRKIKKIQPGEGVVTTGGLLNKDVRAPFIIHVPGPKIKSDDKGQLIVTDVEKDLLKKSYTTILNLATEAPNQHPDSWSDEALAQFQQSNQPQLSRVISLPALSVGIYKFPVDQATQIALETMVEWIKNNPGKLDEIHLVFRKQDKNIQDVYFQKLQLTN